MKTKSIATATTEALKAELGTIEATYNRVAIEFKNSKKELKSCPANLIDRLGRYNGAEDDAVSKGKYLDVFFKSTHEARKGAERGCEVRLSAGMSAKTGVRVTSTVKGIEASTAPVAEQFAAAQKLARVIYAIREELSRRSDAEKAAALNEAVNEALFGKPAAAVPALELAAA